MNLESILQRLYGLHRFGIKPGLERTLALLDRVGNPHRDLQCVHVAGTNGKGSVCSTIHSILVEAGYDCGLYTSPHVHRFNERIRFNRECIDDQFLCELYAEVEPYIAEHEATFFEVTTVIAFLAFAKKNMQYVALETGMGGLYDSTNVVTPCVSIITSIDRDHEEYLGDTLEKICMQKAGIIKPGVPVVIGEQRQELQVLLRNVALERSAPLYVAAEYIDVSSDAVDKNLRQERCITNTKNNLHIKAHAALCGEHQARNLACVLTALDVMNNKIEIDDAALTTGIERVADNAGIRGRCQVVSADPLVIADVGHNEACIRECVSVINQSPYALCSFSVVYGVMNDKDCVSMLSLLAPLCATLYAGTPNTERAMDAETIVQHARQAGMDARNCGTIADALDQALCQGKPVLVTGSFYVVDEALQALRA